MLGRQLVSPREALTVATRCFYTPRATSHCAKQLFATPTSWDEDAGESLRLLWRNVLEADALS